ncbi:MAG: cell division protein, partial [Cyanobacteriota bacterium]
MFNWFRRNEKAQQPPETKPAETKPAEIKPAEIKPEVTTEAEKSSAEVAEPDYLAFAKAAYKNIQERKGEVQQLVKPVDEPEKEPTSEDIAEPEPENEPETVEADIDELDVAESAPESTEVLGEEIKGVEEVTETIEEEAVEPQTPQPAANVPAWMQKSQGLAKLKETAIETPIAEVETAETELDEDFIWSS